MTRVLMFVPQYPYPVLGGLEKQAHELAKALVSMGVDVRVVSGLVANGVAGEEVVEGIRVTRLPWSQSRRVRFLCAPWDIARILWFRRREFDVLHLHQFSPVSLYAIVLARLLGKPVLTKLPNIGDCGLPGLRHQPLGWLRLKILLSSNAIVSMLEQSSRELQSFGFPGSRVLRAPNGIDLSRIAVCMPRDDTNRTVCRVVFVGRLSEEKQLSTLLDAWRILRESCQSSAELRLWGDGPLASELKAQAARLGIAETVLFEGQVDNVPMHLRKMDIFVLSSSAEGNSNAVLEAMAAELPIVATAVGGTPMQVGAEGAPFLCPTGDPHAFADALRRLIENPALRHVTGAAMRRRAVQHFDIQRIAKIYLHAYRCLSEKRADEIWRSGHPELTDSGWYVP